MDYIMENVFSTGDTYVIYSLIRSLNNVKYKAWDQRRELSSLVVIFFL